MYSRALPCRRAPIARTLLAILVLGGALAACSREPVRLNDGNSIVQPTPDKTVDAIIRGLAQPAVAASPAAPLASPPAQLSSAQSIPRPTPPPPPPPTSGGPQARSAPTSTSTPVPATATPAQPRSTARPASTATPSPAQPARSGPTPTSASTPARPRTTSTPGR
jgi:hypothetical protein